jgi:hypothetical protein
VLHLRVSVVVIMLVVVVVIMRVVVVVTMLVVVTMRVMMIVTMRVLMRVVGVALDGAVSTHVFMRARTVMVMLGGRASRRRRFRRTAAHGAHQSTSRSFTLSSSPDTTSHWCP